jgi:hypothetical protein
MIIGKSLAAAEFNQFFKNHYSADFFLTRMLWQKLQEEPLMLQQAMDSVFEDYRAAIASLSPKIVIPSQYEIYFLRNILFLNRIGMALLFLKD